MEHFGPDKLKVWINNKTGAVIKADICYCQADGSYSRIFLNTGKCYLISKTLKWLENELGEEYFFRCHRSCLINLLEVERIDFEEKLAYQKLYQIPVSSNKLVELICKRNAYKLNG